MIECTSTHEQGLCCLPKISPNTELSTKILQMATGTQGLLFLLPSLRCCGDCCHAMAFGLNLEET